MAANFVSHKDLRLIINKYIHFYFRTESAGARIVGDDNTISSLVSVNPQVNAGVNILNTVTQTVSGATGSGGAEKGEGLLGGVLGGLGGGANNIGGRQVSKCSKL